MEQIAQTYQRLPGARRTPLRKATLWLASDHILSIDSRRFSEEYKRYYFKDIQAIVVRQTTGSTLSRAIEMVMVIVLALLGVAAWRLQSIGTAAAAGVILLAFLIFKLLGPLCACHLITAVSSDRLPSLDRLRDAEQALGIIGPLVRQAQRESAP
jgi:hypothetical protein